MKTKLFVRAIQLLPVFLFGCTMTQAQQLKLGNNPSALQKSALLELESNNQGLLLTRISDTTTGPITSAPDGMIIYLTTNNSLCIRSNGYWRPLLPAGYALTNLNGQTVATQQLATTNTTGAYGFTSATGTHTLNIPDATATNSGFVNTGTQTLAGAKTFNSTLTANQDVYLSGIGVDNTKDSVVLIDGGRLLKKRLTTLAPTGTAGGDLTGTYPNPTIATGAVTGTKIAQAGATSGQVLKWDGTTWAPANDEGIGLSSQTANTVLAAPNGSNGMPGFRSLVPADMTLNYPGRLVGRYSGGAGGAQEISLDRTIKMYPNGGTAYLYVDTTIAVQNASKLQNWPITLATPTTGQVLTYNGTAWAPAAPAASGLTSVGLNGSSIFTITNNPLTSNGVINIALADQAANTVLAGSATGGNATPGFRTLGIGDIQSVNTQRLLGRYAAGVGATQEVVLDNTLKLNTAGTLYADSALSVWNASRLQGVRVAATAPTDDYILKYNAATSSWGPEAESSATNWQFTGNSNTNASSFLGTTVDQPMVLKYNNRELFRGTKGTGTYASRVVTLFNGAVEYNAHPLVIRANGVDVLAFEDSTATIRYHWNMMGGGLNFVESNVKDYRLYLQRGGNIGIDTSGPSSKLYVNGAFAVPVYTNNGGNNSTYTFDNTDHTYIKAGTGTHTVTLPDAATCAGRIYVIKRAANGTLQVRSNGGAIDGTPANGTLTMPTTNYISYTFQSDGRNWYIISGI